MAEKEKNFNPNFYRALRFIPARGKFAGLPDFGITETFQRLRGKQPTTQIIGSGFKAKTYDIDPVEQAEVKQDLADQATLFDEKGEYVGGVLPEGSGIQPVKINEKDSAISDELPNKAVEFAKDYAERVLLGKQIDNRALRFNQDLINQQTAALSERNRQALANQLAFTKFDTTQIAKNQLRAAQREGILFDAVGNQLRAAAVASSQGIQPRGRAGGA